MNRPSICTIVSANYLSYARVLAKSFLEQHPDGQVFVLLVDHLPEELDLTAEPYELILAHDLKIPFFDRMSFQYEVTELNTAVKPFFLDFLLREKKLESLVYLDPDILVTNLFTHVFDLLTSHSIVLTPHLTEPIRDSRKPDELDILLAGNYNLGFIGVSAGSVTQDFLRWWQKHMKDNCIIALLQGVFVDQKWIDLVPNIFPEVYVLRDEAYNVAPWNLQSRKISKDDKGRYLVNGMPLVFYHFSGYKPEKPNEISFHQTRTKLKDNPALKSLYDEYRSLQLKAGYETWRKKRYAYEYFDNGVSIVRWNRHHYRSLSERDKKRFGNPFQTGGSESYYTWLQTPLKKSANGVTLTNLHLMFYRSRDDLEHAFPDIFGRNLQDFADWMTGKGHSDHGFDFDFLSVLRPSVVKRERALTEPRPAFKVYKAPWWKRLIEKRHTVRTYVAFVRWLRLSIGEYRFQRLLRFLGIVSSSDMTVDLGTHQPVVSSLGVNVMGYLTSESGTAEAARSSVASMKTTSIPYDLVNISSTYSRKSDQTLSDEISQMHPHDINLVHVNADQVEPFMKTMSPSFWRSSYNIGYWAWELSSFPNQWISRFRHFHEIWTLSSFSQTSIATISPIPVVKVMPSIDINVKDRLSRDHFGLLRDEFVFLFMFDFFSFFERKNPVALVQAFQMAFGMDVPVRLVIKHINGEHNRDDLDRLNEVISGDSRITIMDNYMSRDEVYSLIDCCDAYVSLHRSEGFGLTLAEAMYMGKPVIATAYSGNMDFMRDENSYLVHYDLEEIKKDHGPYEAGMMWSNPNVEHAALQMKRVFEHQDEASGVGNVASYDVKKMLSPEAIGEAIEGRLRSCVLELS